MFARRANLSMMAQHKSQQKLLELLTVRVLSREQCVGIRVMEVLIKVDGVR